jgi:hypothetical protein
MVDLDKTRALLASVAGFTPGPWDRSPDGLVWAGDRAFDPLCHVVDLHDARLIAAAPDLHRELTEAVGEIERLRAHNARMGAQLLALADGCDRARNVYGSKWGENGGAEDVACLLPGDTWAETGAAIRDLANDLPPIHDSDAMTAWEASRRLAAGEVDDG